MSTKLLDKLVESIYSFKSKKELKEFFIGILTPQEIEEIPTRLQIIKQLKKGIPQHEIAEKLKVGIATVTRGSKELAKGHFKNI